MCKFVNYFFYMTEQVWEEEEPENKQTLTASVQSMILCCPQNPSWELFSR